MASNSRERVLEGALDVLRSGQPVTLDAAAKQVGLTKPGLMYHFPTKEALMIGLTDHVADWWRAKLSEYLPMEFEASSPTDRTRAYAELALTEEFDDIQLVMLADPRLRAQLSARWTDRMAEWVEVPPHVSDEQRGRLIAVRLLADGAWIASSLDIFAPDHSDRERVRAIVNLLLEG